MTVSYSAPLSAAMRRTKTVLFAPFDAMRWLTLALSAWLAKMSDGDWWGAGANFSDSRDMDQVSSGTIHFFENTYETLVASVVLTVLALAVTLILIGFSIFLLWVSSRARFMFLDSVVTGKVEIKAPWARFRDAGRSLFLWRLGFSIAAMVVMGVVGAVTLVLIIPHIRDGVYDSRFWATIAFGGGIIAILATLSKFVDLLLTGFVVPIMYRTGLPVTAAWSRFIPLFRERLLEFVLFGLLSLAIHLGVFVLVGVAGLLTCCVGFLLVGLPYINAVVLLPVLVFFRLFPIEFLNQFGDTFRIDLDARESGSTGA